LQSIDFIKTDSLIYKEYLKIIKDTFSTYVVCDKEKDAVKTMCEYIEDLIKKSPIKYKNNYFKSFINEYFKTINIDSMQEFYNNHQEFSFFEYNTSYHYGYILLASCLNISISSHLINHPEENYVLTEERTLNIILNYIDTYLTVLNSSFISSKHAMDSISNRNFHEFEGLVVLKDDLNKLQDKYDKLKASIDIKVSDEIKKQSNSIEQEKTTMLSEQKHLKEKIKALEEKNNELQKNLNKQIKINTHNENLLNKMKSNNTSSKNITTNIPESNSTISEEPQDRSININRKILFVGASPSMLSKLQNIYSNAQNTDFNSAKINKNFVSKFDCIVFLNAKPTTNPYNAYAKIKTIADKCKIKYINCKNNNIDLIVDNIENTFT
jgi:hypothetical protein